ncbi:glycosyltransferase family 4 protein [uncultured Parvibaculum sp.]|uniref:glycosyltransferase family 4 protein n=1 Tax=uncultured Parvibaculum sp. TaxID=291828 RepID=UPI0030DDA4D1
MSNAFENICNAAILQLVPALETGGAERTTVDVARAIVAAGGHALVASRGGRMVAELEAAGARHVEMAVHSKNPVVMALNVERLTRLIAREKIGLVHARSRAPAWSALAAAHRAGIPFVTTYHSRVHERPRLKVFYNSVMTRGDAVIANSEFTAGRIRAVHAPDEARIFTVPRGIDIEGLAPAAIALGRIETLRSHWNLDGAAGVIFIHPARLTRWKGQAVSVEAARLLRARGIEGFTLLLVGDAQGRDEYRAELARAIARDGLQRHVRLVGHCDDMGAAYALSDIVLSPSIEAEPFGRTAVEAQAAARPVIVSDAGGQRETVLTAEGAATGLCVPPGDAGALADAMEQMIAWGREARAAMGARGQAHVAAHYSVASMCKTTLGIYDRLLGR